MFVKTREKKPKTKILAYPFILEIKLTNTSKLLNEWVFYTIFDLHCVRLYVRVLILFPLCLFLYYNNSKKIVK